MKQNIIAVGLKASAGLTFCQAPKAHALRVVICGHTYFDDYTGRNEDNEKEEVDTQ